MGRGRHRDDRVQEGCSKAARLLENIMKLVAKSCSKCPVVKTVDRFKRNSRRQDGLNTACKDCDNARRRERYSKDPEYRAKRISQANDYEGRGEYLRNWKKEWRKDPEVKEKMKDQWLSYKYNNMSLEKYNEMMTAQRGRCAICNVITSQLVVDHCHSSGETRGLLCSHCNWGLGHFKDNPEVLERAISYLSQGYWRI